MRGYVICTTPRSGSNFLSELLESTGKLGRPREYFNAAARRTLDDPSYPDAPAEQVTCILRDGATSNGIYALKAFPDHWRDAAARVPLTELLPALRYVRLMRRDLLAQAISWSLALQTQQYRSTQNVIAKPAYDGHSISECLRRLALFEADWSVFFSRTGLEALPLFYEEVEREPEHAVKLIADWLQIDDATVDPQRVQLCIQRNELNEAWRKQFLAEYGAPDAIFPATFQSDAGTEAEFTRGPAATLPRFARSLIHRLRSH